MTPGSILDTMLNQEIVKQLLLDENPHITDEEVLKIWKKCKNNPWSAPILYHLMKL